MRQQHKRQLQYPLQETDNGTARRKPHATDPRDEPTTEDQGEIPYLAKLDGPWS